MIHGQGWDDYYECTIGGAAISRMRLISVLDIIIMGDILGVLV